MENENKTTAAPEQPEDTQSVAVAEAPDTQSGTVVEGSSDTPADGEGCESVTVIVAETHPDHPEYAKMAAKSVKKNLIGVDAMVVIMGYEPQMPMSQALLRMLEMVNTERIILMTDGMFILNPVTIHNIGVRKSPATNMPVLMYKSVLEPLLKEMAADIPYADVAETYAEASTEVAPIIVGDWKIDPWLLPLISKNPSIEAVGKFAKWKMFMHVGPESWSDDLLKFLEERFPE